MGLDRLRLVLVVAALLVFATPAIAQVEFLRGDANADGRVSGSDAHFILSFLFRGSVVPSCMRATDPQADGELNLTDAIFLLNFLSLGGVAPCPPFPEPGIFETNDLDCDSYDVEPPLEDSAAELRVSNAIASPDGSTTLNVFASSSTDVAGYFGHITLDGASFGDVSSAADLSETLSGGFIAARVFGGRIRVGFLSTLVQTNRIAAGSEIPVMRIDACVEDGTAAGDYSMVFEGAELTDFDTGEAIIPSTPASTLAVPDVVSNGCLSPDEPNTDPVRCPPGQDPPDPPELPDPTIKFDFIRADSNRDGRISIADAIITRDFLFLRGSPLPPCLDAADANDDDQIDLLDLVFTLNFVFLGVGTIGAPFPAPGQDPTEDSFGCHTEEVTAANPERVDAIDFEDTIGVPGRDVNVPVLLTNDADIDAYQLFVAFNPDEFTPESLDFDRGFYSSLHEDFGGFESVRLVAGRDDVVSIGLVPDFSRRGFEVPAGPERRVFALRGRLGAGLKLGDMVTLEFTDGDGGFGELGLVNELASGGEVRFPRLGSGRIEIGELNIILRGDANGDNVVNLSDSVFVLNFLFLGGPPPLCLDAADANDDGKFDISDAIGILNTLFLGTPGIAPPFPDEGVDATEDDFPLCG